MTLQKVRGYVDRLIRYGRKEQVENTLIGMGSQGKN
jgi:hypothetical protein